MSAGVYSFTASRFTEGRDDVALAGQGVLAIWNGIAPDAEGDFVAWHVREHIPERVAVPGFLRGRRYVAVAGTPKYFNFYETESPDTLASPPYLQRLNAPSDWTKRVVHHFRDTSRTVCSVAVSVGMGDGAFIGAVRLNGRPDARDIAGQVLASIAEPALAEPGIVALHLLEGRPDTTQSAEKAMRDQPDQSVAWILLVEATDREPLDRAFAGPITRPALVSAGLDHGDDDRGVYRLQYALSRDQLR
jgi:hypothetical protein